MTAAIPRAQEQLVTGAELSAVRFATTKGLGRGYDPQQVDVFVARSGAAVDRLTDRLTAAEQELRDAATQIQQLRDRIDRDSRSNEVQQAVTVLTTAQVTADSTVAQADAYSARVMAEARDLYDDTRRQAAVLEQETEDKARAVYQDALDRVAAVERENADRLAQLTLTTATVQQELDHQTAYLRTLRDATRTQMETFLEGLLDHLTEEYGRAHPMAAQAVAATPTSTARRSRRPDRPPRRPTSVAGRTFTQPPELHQQQTTDNPAGTPPPATEDDGSGA